jgi:hypothetical protein
LPLSSRLDAQDIARAGHFADAEDAALLIVALLDPFRNRRVFRDYALWWVVARRLAGE